MADDLGWKVDDGVEKLNIPSSDLEIHSFCDEILVLNGTSSHIVLVDWCDVLSFNLSSEGIVILIVNELDIFTSCYSAANRPQCSKVIRTNRGQSGDDCCWAQVLRNRVDHAQKCHGMTWEHRENQTQMSWKETSAADDISTRKV